MANTAQARELMAEYLKKEYANDPQRLERMLGNLVNGRMDTFVRRSMSDPDFLEKVGRREVEIRPGMVMYDSGLPAANYFKQFDIAGDEPMSGQARERQERDLKRQLRQTQQELEKVINREKQNAQRVKGELEQAQTALKEISEILERVQKEPLVLFQIDRLTKDKKHCFVKKGDQDLRIEACPDLEAGNEVLLHPKTMQIVEHLGRPPLEASRFAPESIPDVKWEDIGGLEVAKADMVEAIEVPHRHKELFAYYGKKQIKGILLSGPPGCGKTMLGKAAARALADIYGAAGSRTGFLYVKGPEILNQYVGQTEQTIRDMFFDAKRHKEEHGYPAIIFLDEADAILAARGTRNIGIGNTIVPQFLTEMDGMDESGAIVIIATNRPDVLDPAIVRDGRIDRKVAVVRPNEQNACAILEMNFAKVPLAKGLSRLSSPLKLRRSSTRPTVRCAVGCCCVTS